MRQAARRWAIAMGIFAAGGLALLAQAPGPVLGSVPGSVPGGSAPGPGTATVPSAPEQVPATAAVTGGRLHGVVKSGNIPLPGVTVTAQNTLTGKRYQTTTDITGAWSLTIPQNGRYVIRTQFAAFAVGSQEALLNAASHDQTVTFDLMLASRAVAQQTSETAGQQVSQLATQLLGGNGAQALSLVSSLAGGADIQAGSQGGAAGASLPSIAGNSDFGGDSVAVSGQAGQVSPMAGMDMDRMRDAMETLRAQGGGRATVLVRPRTGRLPRGAIRD